MKPSPTLFKRYLPFLALPLFLLGWNPASAAQNFLLRYANTTAGAITFSGNTLGLAKLSNQNQPGNLDSIGAFITLNTNLQVGTYPLGTTLNWSNNSSSAVLRIPTNSTVLYAELTWAGSAQIAADVTPTGNVLSNVNAAVQFILPSGATNSVTPDSTTASFVTNGASAIFYGRSANVTALVQAAGAGTYSCGGVPGTVLASENANNACGWTLAVVYANSSLHQRNLSLFIGDSFAISGGPAPSPVSVTGFCLPPTGVINARLFVSAAEGDPSKVGDQMLFGPTTNSLAQLSGTNNLVNNFFAGQINDDSGQLDTNGTFGLSNSVPPTVAFCARQGWDITSVDVSSGLTNGITSAYAQNITQGDGYAVNALALQIDVGSPVLTTSQRVDKASTYVGDTLTYTLVVTNSGTADAINLVFTDPLPFGTSFVTNTFTTNGVVIAGANPVIGVPVSVIKQNSSYTITYKVLVNQIPPSAKFITAATIDFQYVGACANSPIINGALVNSQVQTLVPLLNVSKVASLTNVIPGAIYTYTINIPNIGTTNTYGSFLLDQIPAGVTYVTNTTTLNGVSLPDIGGTNMPYSVTNEIHGPGRPAGQINAGDTAVVTFQVKTSTNPPVRINNTATIQAIGIAPTTAQNASANISPVYCDLAAGIVGNPNPVAAGSPITYTVSITNKGPDSLNTITNFLTLSLPLSAYILSPIYTPSLGSYNPLTGVWSGVTLASNGVITLTINGQLSADAPGTNVVASVIVVPPPGILDTVTNNNRANTTNVITQVADLAVTISDGVTNVHQGDALTYTITAINLGPSTLTSITLSNTFSALLTNLTLLPAQGSFNPGNGVWNGLNLSAGDSVTLTVLATVLPNVTGGLTNTVVASVPSGVTDPVLTNNTASDVDIVLATPDVSVLKAGPATVYAGTNFNYTITVTNLGFATASNLVVSDVLPTNVVFVSASGNGTNSSGIVNWSIATLVTNAGTNLILTVTAPLTGNLTNVASATASTPDINTTNNTSAPVSTTVTPLADLAVGKTAPALVVANSNFTYSVSITNLGPSVASLVVVTDALPAGVTFVSATGGGINTGGVVSWALGNFISGQVSNVAVTVKAPASGSLTNTATGSSATLDTNAVNSTSPKVISSVTALALSANIGVTKIGPTNVLAGTNFTYTITVTNAGPAAATNVVVSDVLPPGVVFVSASSNGTNTAGVVNWNLGTLANTAITNVTLTVITSVGGIITNSASVTSTNADPNLTNNISVPPVITSVTPVADVVIAKTAFSSVWATSNLSYTISVTNLGPSGASSVTVTDTLPVGVTFVSASGNGSNNLGLVTWSLGTLTNGQTTNLTLIVTAPVSGSLTNVASVGGPTGDPVPTNNVTPPVVTGVTPVTDIIILNAGPPNVVAGTTYTNTISVTNAGPSTATNVVVVDTLPNGVTVTNSYPTLAAGSGTNFTVTYTAPGAGSLTNAATGTAGTFDPQLGNNTNIVAVTAVLASADVAVSKTGPAAVGFGFSYDYTISVTNFGPSTATGIAVTDSLPAGLVFVSSIPAATTNASNQVIWTNLGNLVSGATTNLTLTVNSIVHGNVTNLVSGGTPLFDPTLTNNTGVPVVTTITNVAPVAVNQSVTTPEDTSTNLVVHGTDVDSTNLVYAILSGPTNGTLSVLNTNTGAVTYTPNTNYNGGDGFTFTVFDGSLYATGTVALTVTPVNDAPVANDQSVSTPQNTAKPITLTGSDVENSPLTFIIVTSPAHGTLTLLNTNTGAVTYTPSNNYVGPDSFTFRVNDGQTNSAPATVSINVSATSGADVQVTLFGPALATVGDVFSFTNSVTNAGPATAVNTRVTNALPANLTFASASGGGVYSNGVVTWPVFPALASGQVTNLIVSVKTTTSGSTITPTANPLNFLLTNAPPTVSSATNRASAYATTFDPNLTNNIASAFYTNAQAQTLIVPGAFSVVLVTNTYPTNAVPTNTIIPIGTGLFIVGTSAFNPQTQLYEEFVTVTNIGQAPVHALRLSIGNLRTGVKLYNATGTNNGVPYVEYDPPYDSPLNPYPQANSSVTFVLEFFVADRRPFTNSLTAVAINAPPPTTVTGTSVQIIQFGFNDQRSPGNPRYLVQFTSIPGRTYTVQYSDDNMATWNNATPSILASATSTFWYDDGPPVTVSPPPNNGGTTSRFYRVLLNP